MRRAMPPHAAWFRGLAVILAAAVLAGASPAGMIDASPRSQAARDRTAPELRSPADGAELDDATPAFKWSAVRGATTYRFELALDPGFAAPVLAVEDRRRSYTVRTSLDAGVPYFWRAGAVTEGGGIVWSETRSFTVVTREASVAPTAPPLPTATPTPLPRARQTATAEPVLMTAAPSLPASRISGRLDAPAGLRVSGAGRSRGSVSSTSIVDRDLATVWFSPNTTPSSAFVYVKLDRTRKVGLIRWVMGYSGYADRFEIQISTDRSTWKTIGKRTNSAPGTWREIAVDREARYVRFYFTNPKGDPMLGGLAEVEVTGAADATPPTPGATASPTASPTPTSTPTTPAAGTPAATPSASASETATPTPAPSATATATATVAPVTGGLLLNPSFESGGASWHFEGQAAVTTVGAHGGQRALRIAPGGGLADQHVRLLPGGTYELSVWGRTDGGVDLGEVGVIYRDASWTRLRGLEPRELTFTSSTYQKRTLVFTVPEGVAHVSVAIWKTSGPAGLLVDDIYLVKSLAALPAPTVTPPSLACQRLIAPAYFYPTTGYWETMIVDGSALGIIVLNPNSGVGAKHEWRYDAPLAKARSAGIRIIGYIQTDYGTRAVGEILTEMDRYREWYGVTSFFLDEGDTDVASLALYAEMTAYAHAMGGITVINFGYHPHPAYMDVTDYAIVFEDAMRVFLEYEPPAWIEDYPAERFMNLIYGVPADRVDEILAITRERNLGTVWITDDHINTGSPYNTLPTYWSSLNRTLAGSCSGS